MGEVMKETEERIFDYICNNIEECIEIGIRGVAKKTYTSTSSIVRLSKKLGYKGYTDMTYSLRSQRTRREFLPVERDSRYRVRSRSEVTKFIDCLLNMKIAVYGEEFSGIVAQYINNRLFTLGIESHLLDCIDSKLFFDGIGKTYDALIVISNTGESAKCLNILKNAELSPKDYLTVSFTGKFENTIAKNSDVSFVIEGISTENRIVKQPTPFYGNVILGFEELLKLYLERKRTL